MNMKLKAEHKTIRSIMVMILLWAATTPGLKAVILDSGIDPANLGKGDWIYFIQDATNQLGGNVSSVHDLPTFMAYEKSQGMNYIIVKAGDGGNDFDGNYGFPQFNSNLVFQAHAAGLQIFGYTRSYGTNVPGEIAMGAKVYNLGADGFVLDAEAEWESSHLGTNGPTLAIQLCSGIKAQFPTKFLGHSPLPIISFHSSFPYAQFGYYCDAVMPQDYWQDGGLGALVNYSPSNMVTRMDSEWSTWQHSLTGQWTNAIKPLAPLGQGWNPTSTNITTGAQITQFFNALKGDSNPVTAGGYKGISFWRADLHTADMWTGIGGNTIGNTNSAPYITTQPLSQSVVQGSNVTFTATASGYPPPR
ncbi:MAG TPA: immunoglobulin domain-containing protein, partial [Verrucomicrobiae bacterium]|nr:immunoglobulin domain-containing protein [Verrucomicrobiae bacterium]